MKKQLISKEFLKMQKVAGLITEGQYKKILSENEELSPSEVSEKMKEILKDPKFEAGMEKFWEKLQSELSPEDLEKFKQNILNAGIVQEEQNINEDSFNKAFNIAYDAAQNLNLSEDYDYAKNKTKYIAGSIISGIGKVGTSMIPAALVAAGVFEVGPWGLGLQAVMVASLIAGTALWWLGDKIKEDSY